MGMDVYGVKPATDKGDHFRNNVWWWRPLWEFCEYAAPHLTKQVKNAQTNDGDGLDAEDSVALATVLTTLIASGAVEEYEIERNEKLGRIPRHTCNLCEGTGVRVDAVGVSMGMPTKVLDEARAVFLGRLAGWCNACDGEGTKEDIELSYRFTVGNVSMFAEFLQHCGGFKIC